MKKIIQILTRHTAIPFILFIIISKSAVAQQTDIKYDAPVIIETVILKFPDINSAKVYTALQTVLAGINGVSIHGRCPDSDVLYLKIDRRYFPKNDDLLKKIADANFFYEVVENKNAVKQNGICSEDQATK